ncbi:MAG: radical SAM protein [Sulfuricaulis sp.]
MRPTKTHVSFLKRRHGRPGSECSKECSAAILPQSAKRLTMANGIEYHYSENTKSQDKVYLWYSRNSDLFTEEADVDMASGSWFSAPYSICIEVGQHCNFRCNVCISDSSPDHRRREDWIVGALVNIGKAFGPVRLVWSGGEPVLYPEILDYIHHSRSLGNANVLVTNASRFIREAPVDWIDISVYGHSKETFEKYTKSSLFETFKRNLYRYSTEYHRVSASFILGLHGSSCLKSMVQMVLDAGVKRLKFHRLSLAGRNDLMQGGETADLEAAAIQAYLNGLPIHASYTRTKSSEHKRKGYWVTKAPGVLTNSDVSISLTNSVEVARAIAGYSSMNKSLFS